MTEASVVSTLSASDEQAIRTLVQEASAAQNDPDLLIPLHTSDAVIVNFFGRRVLGRGAFEQAMRAAVSSPLRHVVTDVEIVDIRPVTDSVALVSCIKTVHDGRENRSAAELPASAGALTYVVRHTDGTWQIALAQTTPIGS
ncbi:MAG TPA: SgcJ/EcaC family oxidoreductase [Aeromicrobium sp.]|nr:SgcJ/EcaC family oxidoreductase [Aeromicrobium sp.]